MGLACKWVDTFVRFRRYPYQVTVLLFAVGQSGKAGD